MTGEVLGHVLKVLDNLGIPYMLTGSFAGNYYAEPRSTHDADIVIHTRTGDAVRLAQALGDDFVVSHDRLASAQQFNAIHVATSFKIDFWPYKESPFDQSAFARRRTVSLFGRRVPIPTPEDLTLQKLRWAKDTGSEQQRRDVQGILRAQEGSLDWEYLTRWAETLGVRDDLENLRNASGSEHAP